MILRRNINLFIHTIIEYLGDNKIKKYIISSKQRIYKIAGKNL